MKKLQVTSEQHKVHLCIKPKVKDIRGSARPIGGLEKTSRSKKRIKKNANIMAHPPQLPQEHNDGTIILKHC
jgi:hypothetical protein